ncbi:MAG: hypothetical protein IMZ61_13880 [Planctomycetes bacterium]|nr:hypothetical protein [Chloroflexota bacterium]MBE3144987.1 hypothetical protein [Planctomycetota bacterium]
MNDRVEEIYTQMFAPQPIPQSVREMYDRTVFLANRIDCQLTMGALVLIAATATKTSATSVSKPIVPEEVDIHAIAETLPVQPADMLSYVTNTAPHPSVEPQEGKDVPNGADRPAFATTGPMDAPQGPTTESGKNSLERSLHGMTKNELIAHAIDACKMTMEQVVGKTKAGKATKAEIQFTSKSKIIERILGQNNG